jgi:acyl-CoA dehydrogenase
MSQSQAVQFALAEMQTDLQMARAFLNDLIVAHVENQSVVIETSMAKFKIF